MTRSGALPERLLRILCTCEADEGACFPPTEFFNEGWMLRLVLDAMRSLKIAGHPLTFAEGAGWYSEALLESPFRPRHRADRLAEGFTNADGVIGQFDFRATTKAGLRLKPEATQFVVAEAKMFSNLSTGTKNAPAFNQAARNVACMAWALAQTGRPLSAFRSLGFLVIAPRKESRGAGVSNLETAIMPEAIKLAVHERIAAYETQERHEGPDLRRWEADTFLPFVDLLVASGGLAVLSWEDCIETVRQAGPGDGEELDLFYQRCLTFAPMAARSPKVQGAEPTA